MDVIRMNNNDKIQFAKNLMMTILWALLLILFFIAAAFNVKIFGKGVTEMAPFICCICFVLLVIFGARTLEVFFRESRLNEKVLDFIYLNEYEIYNLRIDELEVLAGIIFKQKGYSLKFGDSVTSESFIATNLNKRFYVYVYKSPEMITVGEMKDFLYQKEFNSFNKNIIVSNSIFSTAAKEYAEEKNIILFGINEVMKLKEKIRKDYENN